VQLTEKSTTSPNYLPMTVMGAPHTAKELMRNFDENHKQGN
jgi:hypothetical protein